MADIHARARAEGAAKMAAEAQQIKETSDLLTVENGPFEAVLPFLKIGRRAQRAGWNGKGMHVFVEVPADDGYLPYFCMKAADGRIVTGWLASQTDLLAHDWRLLATDE